MRLTKKVYSCLSRRIQIILDDPNIFAFLPELHIDVCEMSNFFDCS